MKQHLREFLTHASVPLILIICLLTVMLLYQLFDLPTKSEIIDFSRNYYERYGYVLVLLAALAEGALLINWYLPGSVVIVFSVALAKPDPIRAVFMVLLVILGFLLATLGNYALGKYGWYRLLLKFGLKQPLERTKARVENKGLGIIFSTYVHPNLGALTATSAGILQIPFQKFFFYSLAALIAWNSLWGIVTYTTGPVILEYIGIQLVAGMLLLWLIVAAVQFARSKKYDFTTWLRISHISLVTILVSRVSLWLLEHNEIHKYVYVSGFRWHHFYTGIVLMLLSLIFPKGTLRSISLGIGLGLCIDEITLPLFLSGFTSFSYWSIWAISAVVAAQIIIYVLDHQKRSKRAII